MKGDTLWKISETHYGKGKGAKYTVIFEANRPMLSHPDKIYPGPGAAHSPARSGLNAGTRTDRERPFASDHAEGFVFSKAGTAFSNACIHSTRFGQNARQSPLKRRSR